MKKTLAFLVAAAAPCWANPDPLSGGAADVPPAGATYGDYGDAGDLARAAQNPVADLISLPFQHNFLFTEDDHDLIWVMNVQPVVPFSLNEQWNLITRTIIPVIGAENVPDGFDSFGIGDINTSLFFSPKEPVNGIILGAGPIVSLPTASDDIFGTGKLSVGPSVVALTMRGPWVIGATANNLFSVAGDGNRNYVNQFLVQPFINYNFDGGWYATASPIITANWEADSGERWTVPLGGGFGRVFPIGDQPVNVSLQGFYNVEHPTGAPEWSLRFQFTFLFPQG